MRRAMLLEAASVALIAGLVGACHDTCFLVVGCRDSARIAVEGRILTAESGSAMPGAKLILIANTASAAESTQTVSDARGLFSLVLPVVAGVPTTLALRVRPPGTPGYIISPLDCKPVTKWGDACVMNPIVAEPTFPIIQFLYRNNMPQVAANVRVTFKRTGGATFFGPDVTDPIQVVTDASGIGLLFPPGIYAGSLDRVIGDLTVDLPPPIGPTVRRNYSIPPNARFNDRLFVVQPTGPTLEYLMVFADSSSGRRLKGVDVRYQRRSGIPTNVESFRVSSTDDGLAFFMLTPLAQGTITGDFSITPPGSSITTPMNGVSLTTFDADSSIVLSRWTVGATGILYPIPPGGM